MRTRIAISLRLHCACTFLLHWAYAVRLKIRHLLRLNLLDHRARIRRTILLWLSESRFWLTTARPIERIAVGSGDLAEATAVSPTEIMLNGKAPGETTLIVWQAGGARQFFNVTVRASSYAANDRLDSLRRELRTELPGQTLRVTTENGLIFLRGTVKDLRSSDRAVQIASTAGKVVNLLYVNVPTAEPQILLKVRFASLDRNAEAAWNKSI